jgi:hypothetical protein
MPSSLRRHRQARSDQRNGMLNYRALQWGKALAYVAGGGCAVIFALGGPRWTAIGLAVAAAASLLNILIQTPQDKLTPTATAVDNSGAVTGENVTTTTTTPILAPQKEAP